MKLSCGLGHSLKPISYYRDLITQRGQYYLHQFNGVLVILSDKQPFHLPSIEQVMRQGGKRTVKVAP
jgi:hypothetical protein